MTDRPPVTLSADDFDSFCDAFKQTLDTCLDFIEAIEHDYPNSFAETRAALGRARDHLLGFQRAATGQHPDPDVTPYPAT